MTTTLDKALLCAEQDLCLAMSLIRTLEVTDFDRRTTTSGNQIDAAILNDVMGIVHKYVADAAESIEPFARKARNRHDEAKAREAGGES
ncbi:MAG: hypothetical protein KZQ92_06725 [Candidatus Thiodiazotropha sp. (ex Lucinoma borealis)]|nr:hypothetical protein [Candidatus Thiodiazotropha sp. (ex Lucinoma borealis)]